jgi:Ser/Thr protein kinase RdoA (MazF antagonist)
VSGAPPFGGAQILRLDAVATTSRLRQRHFVISSQREQVGAASVRVRAVVSEPGATLISRWETELLQHLDREGLAVPVPIPTKDGRLFADGLVVMTYLDGGPPETPADWRRVASTLRELHRLTQGWPQRPGWRSSTDLLHAETGTKIDLGAMPSESVARCRAAWARFTGRQTCVVHGDPNPGNVRMTANQVALIDWDESHVDVPDLDLVLPDNAAGLDDGAHDMAAQASAAWEAAVCWDDEYAVKRLAEVRAV